MPKRYVTLEEAIDMVFSQPDERQDEVEVCQLPPDESGDITDEEHVNEDALCPVIPVDVCGQVEVSFRNDCDSPDTSASTRKNRKRKATVTEGEDFTQPSTSRQTCSSNERGKGRSDEGIRRWKKSAKFSRKIRSEAPKRISEEHPDLCNLSCFDLFGKFLHYEYVAYLANMTKTYASQKGALIDVEVEDILQLWGILLLSGYHKVPSEDMYWSTADDVCIPVVGTVMARSKFRTLKRYFHLMDNTTLVPGDKLGKIRPFYDELSKQFRQFGTFHQVLSIDESMVPYYGHHSCKMFIRGKPIRFGYKIWMMCSSNGYPYGMEIYAGRKPEEQSAPLGTRVVTSMVALLEQPSAHEVYFDNFFTSHQLLRSLRDSDIKATGTIREQRCGRCPLKDKKEMRKLCRGDFDFRCDGDVYVCTWNDNAVVRVASNHLTHQPVGKTKRYSRVQHARIDVKQPHVIRRYNEGMGGVDLLDRLLGSYRPELRCRKWWWALFSNGLNMAVVTAWLLHCELHKGTAATMTHLEFRRDVVRELLAMKEKLKVRPGPRAHPSIRARTTSGHYLSCTTQGRCALCKANTTKICHQCGKRLHERCFPHYHGL